MVGGDGAQLGDEEMRRDAIAELLDRGDRLPCAIAADEVFRLQLAAARGREVHAEVRQPLVPRAGDSLLLGAVDRIMPDDRMKLLRGQRCTVELTWPIVGTAGFETALD